MQKNLRARALIIAATIVACIFGVIGFPKSKASLLKNVRDNIRLGLDLKGGSHLVLRVKPDNVKIQVTRSAVSSLVATDAKKS